MTTQTLASFIESTHLDGGLVRSTVRQFGTWAEFKESASDMARSADAGFSGFIYYADTCAFARRNLKALVDLCEQFAEDFGEGGAIEVIKGFNCLKGQDLTSDEVGRVIYGRDRSSDEATQILNALAWLALEEVARAVEDWAEN